MITTNARRVSGERPRKAQLISDAQKPHALVAASKGLRGGDPRSEFSDEEWGDMVATAAYFRCASRGFEEGSADQDWYEAEAELRERFSPEESNIEAVSTPGG